MVKKSEIVKPDFSVKSLSDTDLARLKNGLKQIVDSMIRIDAERDNIKREREALVETLNVSGAILSRLAKALHKASFQDEKEQFELFEDIYKEIQ